MKDVTLRALEVIEQCDYLLCEDTRQTAKILSHYNISKRLISFHQHSAHKIESILKDLQEGKTIGLFSDAGTTGVCDPGGLLAKSLFDAGLEVSCLPGPSALTALISVAPFACSEFVFVGYFPKKKGRNKMVDRIKSLKVPVFFFESPHRIISTLEFLKREIPESYILIGRELTKKFEQIIYRKISEIDEKELITRGEFVLAISPCQEKKNIG